MPNIIDDANEVLGGGEDFSVEVRLARFALDAIAQIRHMADISASCFCPGALDFLDDHDIPEDDVAAGVER